MDLDIDDIGVPGIVLDKPAYMLPPEAWSSALNMRYVDDGMKSIPGWEQVFGTPGGAPHFAIPVVSPAQTYWLYMSLTKGYVWDSSAHTDITRASGDYTTAETRDINGTIFAGIPILNTGADDPQYWGSFSSSTKLAPLTAWPSGATIKVIRSFGAYLVGVNYSVGGNQYPHLVKWSASASGAGALPASWDETDDTLDAGEYDLPDVNSGVLLDAMTLGSKLMLYKEQAIWSMRYIGGRAIFAFDTFSPIIGILAPRCVALTRDGKKHVVVTQDDIIIHDGVNDPVSIVEKRMRRTIFNNIDTTNYLNSFLYSDPANNEIVFAYPESGVTNPSRGLVFNYKTGSLTEIDGITYRNAAVGTVEDTDTELWSTGTDTWDTDTGPWSTQERRQVVFCDPDDTKLFKSSSSTYTRDGVAYECTLQRTGLALVGKKRNGEWIVNHEVMKFVSRLWPKVQGGPIRIRVGYAMEVDGSVTWGAYQNFDPTTDVTVDEAISGRAIAVEFSVGTALDWRFDGYLMTVEADGRY